MEQFGINRKRNSCGSGKTLASMVALVQKAGRIP